MINKNEDIKNTALLNIKYQSYYSYDAWRSNYKSRILFNVDLAIKQCLLDCKTLEYKLRQTSVKLINERTK